MRYFLKKDFFFKKKSFHRPCSVCPDPTRDVTTGHPPCPGPDTPSPVRPDSGPVTSRAGHPPPVRPGHPPPPHCCIASPSSFRPAPDEISPPTFLHFSCPISSPQWKSMNDRCTRYQNPPTSPKMEVYERLMYEIPEPTNLIFVKEGDSGREAKGKWRPKVKAIIREHEAELPPLPVHHPRNFSSTFLHFSCPISSPLRAHGC
jgi:hypothetical protein